MIPIPDLETSLLELLYEIDGTNIKLIIGGGFGIYLKSSYARRVGMRTLLREWPEPRSTNDLDLFLRPELLIDSTKLRPLAEAITNLGYQVVPGAENYQFVKPGLGGADAGGIKLDFLTGPQDSFQNTNVKVDDRRAHPKPSVGIHAHPVDEALSLEKGLLPVPISGKIGPGGLWEGEVYLPHPYTFSMMKLFAFRDRLYDADKEFGRYHALDLYSIHATTSEEEWHYALELRDQLVDHPYCSRGGTRGF